MQNSKNISLLALLTLSLLLTACGKSEDQALGTVGMTSAKAVDGKQINAFISGNEISKKSFVQGAELAVAHSSTKTFDLKFFQDSPTSLEAHSKVPAVIYWSADDISPVAPSLSGADTVGIVAADVNDKVIRLGANVYGFGYSTELTFKQFAKFAGNKLKSYRFAVITSNDPAFDLQSRAFIEETKSLGNTIVFEQVIDSGYEDFKSLVTRATSENCDTIIALLPASQLMSFIRSAKANQFKGKVIVGDSLFASDIASLGQDAEGIHMPQAWSDDANLKSLYAAKFGSAPDGITLGYAALGFDLLKCLQGINGPLDAYSMKSSLLSTSCEGITGNTQFTGERVAQRRKAILTVKDGQIVKGE